MGLFSGISSIFSAPLSILGGGGGGSSSMTSGGIGSETGNTSNAGNSTTTTTTSSNVDKRQVINSGGVGIANDTGAITVNNNSSDPQNYQALLAVTDHLASLALGGTSLMEQAQASTASGQVTATTDSKTAVSDFFAKNKAAVLLGGAVVVYLMWKR